MDPKFNKTLMRVLMEEFGPSVRKYGLSEPNAVIDWSDQGFIDDEEICSAMLDGFPAEEACIGASEACIYVPAIGGESNWSNLTKALRPYLSERLSLHFIYPPLDDMSKLELVSYHDSTETGDYLLTLKFKSPYTRPAGAAPLS